MKAKLALAVALAAVLTGCGKNVGWIIKPVPVDETLRETVVISEPGLFVTDKIVLVDVDGMLFNQRRGGLFDYSDNPVSMFVEKLDKAQSDPHVKAVVVRINSPGGGVTASDIMYSRLKRFKQARKLPVVAVIEDVGASGGYYVACAADRIIAHPTSVTGSIGTMVQTISLSGTMKWLRIDAKAITSGPRKDMASPFKPLDPDDLAILQQMVDEYYQRFLDVVGASRKELDADRIKTLADGRVYTGRQAKEEGLVDALGTVEDAVVAAKSACGDARVKVVMYHRPVGYRANVYSAAPSTTAGGDVNLVNLSADQLLSAAQPQFLYLWTGHTYR